MDLDTPPSVARSGLVRAALVILGLVAIELGVWALFAPHGFYRSFPGMGRHWVSVDGPYNEHLVRDFGEYNLALALVTFAAAVKLTPTLVRVASGAWLVSQLPHLLYHLAHLDVLPGPDKVGNVVSLGLGVVVPAALLVLTRREASGARPAPRGAVQPPLPAG